MSENKLPDCAPQWIKDAVNGSATVVGKVMPVQTTTDIDWRVEQKLARVLAERNLYWKGIFDGLLLAMIVGYLVWTYAPNFRDMFKEQ